VGLWSIVWVLSWLKSWKMHFRKRLRSRVKWGIKNKKKAPAIDSVIVTGPDFIQQPKLGEKDAATDEGANAVQATAPEFNPKQTKSGENIAVTEARAPEAKATSSDEGVNPGKATAVELNPNPTKSTENDAVTEATAPKVKGRGPDSIPTYITTNDNGMSASLGGVLKQPTPVKMVEDSEAMATAPDSIPPDIATKDNGILAAQDEVSQPPSVDQMVQDLKQTIAEENKSSNAPAEVSVEPAMVFLSALSATSPSPGPKAVKKRPATQYTPSPGLRPDKNRATTRSTPSPDPKKKKSSFAAGADKSLMHSGRNFNTLVGMNSLPKVVFHRKLRRYPKYTQLWVYPLLANDGYG
jgi:hypothetical protein